MNTSEKILEFYFATNKLKNTLRTGWIYWSVEGVRVESIAEHVFGTLMLAVSVYANSKEFENLDIEKVALMLALHETEEILIGDITMFDKDRLATKKEAGRKAVEKLFNEGNSKKFLDLIAEFEKRETKEAKFAYMCDKMEADLQAFIYRHNFNLQKANPICLNDENIKKMTKRGLTSVDEFFLESDKNKYTGTFKALAFHLEKLEKEK